LAKNLYYAHHAPAGGFECNRLVTLVKV